MAKVVVAACWARADAADPQGPSIRDSSLNLLGVGAREVENAAVVCGLPVQGGVDILVTKLDTGVQESHRVGVYVT